MKMSIKSTKDLINEFMTSMSLNHGVIRVLKRKEERNNDDKSTPDKEKIYQGTSPDEIALIQFAKDRGFEFRSCTDHFAKLRI